MTAATPPGGRNRRRAACAVATLIAVPLLATGCGGGAQEENAAAPASVRTIEGTSVEQVVLTASAARRIGVRTASVRRVPARAREMSIPYAAVLYDPDGGTWTYTSPRPLVFVRRDVTLDSIEGKTAILAKGPPVGSRVVVEGSTEIWGVEYGGIEED